MRIDGLKDKLGRVPRNKMGDPCFTNLEQVQTLFGNDEITELVNRSLYQLEYQQRSHAKYRQEREELLKPVREAFKTLFPKQSFAKATDEQLLKSVELVKQQRGE